MRSARRGANHIEFLITIMLIAMFVAVYLPSIYRSRESARMTTCQNNLRQLGLGLHNYESTHRVLPPGVVSYVDPMPSELTGYQFGWLVQVLPFLEQRALFEQIDFSRGVHDINNMRWSVPIGTFECTSDPLYRINASPQASYAGNHHHEEAPIASDNMGILFLNSSIRSTDILDGCSSTIFVGEKRIQRTRLSWSSGSRSTLRNTGTPINASPANPPDTWYVGGFGSFHSNGAFFLFGDNSVRFLTEDIDPKAYRNLGNRSDGEITMPPR